MNNHMCHGSHPELSSTRALFNNSSSDVTASRGDNLVHEEGVPHCMTCFLSMSWLNVVHVATWFKSESHASDFVNW